MAQINEIVDSIAGKFGKQFDFEYKSRIKSSLLAARAELIRREVNKYGYVPQNFIQQINATPTNKIDIAEFDSIDLQTAIIRTTSKIPRPIRTRIGMSDFTYVGTIDGKKPYGYISPEDIGSINANKWLKNSVYYTYINSYIYILNDNPKNIRFRGPFNDPYELLNVEGCNASTCLLEASIDQDMEYILRDMVYRDMNLIAIEERQKEVNLEDGQA